MGHNFKESAAMPQSGKNAGSIKVHVHTNMKAVKEPRDVVKMDGRVFKCSAKHFVNFCLSVPSAFFYLFCYLVSCVTLCLS